MTNYRLLSDDELIKGFISGDQNCVDQLIDRHKNRIYSYILLNVKQSDLADDLFQDAFVKIFQSLKKEQYVENGRFVSWALRISHNLVIDHFRQKKKLNTQLYDEPDVAIGNSMKFSDKSIEDVMAYDQILKDVANMVELLPSVQKEVVKMRHFQGLSFKEIAEETNVSINTALGRMRYAIINLRKLMDEKKVSLSM